MRRGENNDFEVNILTSWGKGFLKDREKDDGKKSEELGKHKAKSDTSTSQQIQFLNIADGTKERSLEDFRVRNEKVYALQEFWRGEYNNKSKRS